MGNDKDRLFINRFESFIFTVRKILYFGDTKKSTQFIDPKHDRNRFIKYFGTDNEYYLANSNEFTFDNNFRLKKEFSLLYSYKSLNKIEAGDFYNIFACLSKGSSFTSEEISAKTARSEKNINRRLKKDNELYQSGVILQSSEKPFKYKLNIDLAKDLSDEAKINFLKALDFSIKKNNFVSFAASYKRLIECRDGINEVDLNMEIDHQLFHPILDELNIWSAISALDSHLYIDVKYIYDSYEQKDVVSYNHYIPLKIVFDNIYGRSYLVVCSDNYDKPIILRFDRIYGIKLGDKIGNYNLVSEKIKDLETALSTAWSICIDNSNIQKVIADFRNIPNVEYRLKNELRHGKITDVNDEFLTFQIDVNDPLELTYWFLSFGADCIVRQPQSLVDKIVFTLKEFIK